LLNHRFTMLMGAAALLALPAPAFAKREGKRHKKEEQKEEGNGNVGYDNGMVVKSASGRSAIKFNVRLQDRLEYSMTEIEDVDDDLQPDPTLAFSVPRVRLEAQGNIWQEAWHYEVVTDFGKGGATLKDGFIDYNFKGQGRVRVGQFKRPFSRQQLTGDWKLDQVDRAITDKFFGCGRDIGIMLHDNYTKSPPFEWALGVFNGTGETTITTVSVDPTTGAGTASSTNVPSHMHPLVVGRVGYNTKGFEGYDDVDFKSSQGVGVGLNVLTDLNTDRTKLQEVTETGNDGRMQIGADAMGKVNGITASAGYFMERRQKADKDSWSEQEPYANGFYGQINYLLADTVAPAFRYATVMPDADDSNQSEITAGVGVYLKEHTVAINADYSRLSDEAAKSDTDRLRLQLGLQF
jgi:hypothetical protein